MNMEKLRVYMDLHAPVVKHMIIALVLFIVSILICMLIIRFKGILDSPNSRSSHTKPTPTAGGLAIVVTFFIGMGILHAGADIPIITKKVFYGFTISGFIIAAMSFYDDLQNTTFAVRLAIEIMAVIIAIGSGIIITGTGSVIKGHGINLSVAGGIISFFWILGLTNAYNFMDGLNGMAAGNALIALFFFGWISFIKGNNFTYTATYILIAGTLGFFVFNFPKGRLFMGDVGSTFLGFTFACFAIISSQYGNSHIPLLVIPLLLFHFIYDTFFTFCRRFVSGQNVFKAHKTHLYQLFNQLGFSHAWVSCFYFVLAIIQGYGALFMVEKPGISGFLIFIPYLISQAIYSIIIIYFAKKKNLI